MFDHLKLSDNKLSNNKLSDNKLSDNNLASELVENRTFFKPIASEETVIFMIKTIVAIWGKYMLGYLSLDIICSS